MGDCDTEGQYNSGWNYNIEGRHTLLRGSTVVKGGYIIDGK